MGSDPGVAPSPAPDGRSLGVRRRRRRGFGLCGLHGSGVTGPGAVPSLRFWRPSPAPQHLRDARSSAPSRRRRSRRVARCAAGSGVMRADRCSPLAAVQHRPTNTPRAMPPRPLADEPRRSGGRPTAERPPAEVVVSGPSPGVPSPEVSTVPSSMPSSSLIVPSTTIDLGAFRAAGPPAPTEIRPRPRRGAASGNAIGEGGEGGGPDKCTVVARHRVHAAPPRGCDARVETTRALSPEYPPPTMSCPAGHVAVRV